MKHVVIIPGLGEDQAVRWVKRIVSRWEDETTKTHIFDSRWNAKESFVQKKAAFAGVARWFKFGQRLVC